jgi:hypothetical protein
MTVNKRGRVEAGELIDELLFEKAIITSTCFILHLSYKLTKSEKPGLVTVAVSTPPTYWYVLSKEKENSRSFNVEFDQPPVSYRERAVEVVR